MKVLAVADEFFTPELVDVATEPARVAGVRVDVRRWSFASRAAQQQQMLTVEREGPAAVAEPAALAEPLDHEVLVIQFAPVRSEVIRRAKALRVIIVNRMGIENVDLHAATERGIAVMNTEGRNARAVAEFTVGLIIAELRNIARSHAALKSGSWAGTFPNSGWTPELKDKLVGFVGYGRIGRMVRELLSGFGCRFQAFDPHAKAGSADVPLVGLEPLLATSDVISLHARLTPENRHLIGNRELSLVKPTAILVNTARGGLIDGDALAAALAAGRIGGAALDVFEHEPPATSDPLVCSERTTVTPHLAGTTVDGFLEGPRLVANTLRRILAGDQTLTSVNEVPIALSPTLREQG